MQTLDDDERKDVLGEVLADELKAIMEYVKDVPAIKQELHQGHAVVNEANEKLTVIEHTIREHESNMQRLKRKAA